VLSLLVSFDRFPRQGETGHREGSAYCIWSV